MLADHLAAWIAEPRLRLESRSAARAVQGGLPLGAGDYVDEAGPAQDAARAEYQLWHVYDAGGTTLRLKVRYYDELEAPNWREGPDLQEALDQAAAAGWCAYDREPGNAPGEYAIVHLKRAARFPASH